MKPRADRAGGRTSGGRHPHDQAWKAMFQCAPMAESLLLNFVEPDIVAALDLSSLDLRSSEYVAGGMRTLRGDIVWRAPWRNAPGHLYFPIELQSTADFQMPYRMAEYSLMLLRAANRPARRTARCRSPWVYPMVIYTGRPRWNVVTGLEDTRSIPPGLPQSLFATLEGCQVRQDCRVLSVLHLPARTLEGMDGVAPQLFRLAQSVDPDEVARLSAPFLDRLRAERFAGLRDAVMAWIWHVLLPMLDIREPMPENRTYEELVDMTQQVLDGWKARFMEQGRAEGEAKGRWAEKLDIALNLLRDNATVEKVAAMTGLALDKVRELAAGLKG